ncbi:hypothetical protein BH23ACT9_BH23ACT9_28920 [soil metagenome]
MTITIHRPRSGPRPFDDIGRMLGLNDPPTVTERHLPPSIWKHGRIHNEATQWLEHWYGQRRNDDTAYRYAVALAGWLRHLDANGKTVHDATAEDYRAYEALNRFPADGRDGITSSSWDGIPTVIKQFHEWLLQTWGTDLPFPIEAKYGPLTCTHESNNWRAALPLIGAVMLTVLLAGCGNPRIGTSTSNETLTPLPTSSQPNPDGALVEGTLVGDGAGCLWIDGEIAPWAVLWPPGYSSQIVDDVISLLDQNGTVVAHEGQTVQLGGSDTTTPERQGCGPANTGRTWVAGGASVVPE